MDHQLMIGSSIVLDLLRESSPYSETCTKQSDAENGKVTV